MIKKIIPIIIYPTVLNLIIYTLGQLTNTNFTVSSPQGEQTVTLIMVIFVSIFTTIIGTTIFLTLNKLLKKFAWEIILFLSLAIGLFSLAPFFQESYSLQTNLILGSMHLITPLVFLWQLKKNFLTNTTSQPTTSSKPSD